MPLSGRRGTREINPHIRIPVRNPVGASRRFQKRMIEARTLAILETSESS